MQRDPLDPWLEQIDDAALIPRMPADLPSRVRARLQRRRRNRRIAAGALVAEFAFAALLSVHSVRSKKMSPNDFVTSAGKDSPATLDLQAELRELEAMQADAFAALDQLIHSAQAQSASVPMPDPTAGVDLEVEQAARVLMYQADRLREELNLLQAAADSYRSVIELFPATRAAQTARTRLEQINL
jgi:hypothetical protein